MSRKRFILHCCTPCHGNPAQSPWPSTPSHSLPPQPQESYHEEESKFCPWGNQGKMLQPLLSADEAGPGKQEPSPWKTGSLSWKTGSSPSHHFKRAAEESNRSHGQLGRWLGMRKDALQRESGELGPPLVYPA